MTPKGGKIKKIIISILAFFILVYCRQKQEKVKKIIEDGVEVVLNQIEPYKIQGEPVTFNFLESITIDTENSAIAKLGLDDISCFDVDSKGNIYFLKFVPRPGNNILKFDSSGKCIGSFGSTGQGPGELQYPFHLEIDHQDNVVVTDQAKCKLIIFNKDGILIKESPLDLGIAFVSCLENGKFLTDGQRLDSLRREYTQLSLRLVNSKFEEIKELDRYNVLNSVITKKNKGTPWLFCWSKTKSAVFVGNEERGYEILKYDLDGNLIQKIRKEYKKVPISEKYKKKRIESLPGWLKKITFFPESFPAYQSFFADEKGRLYVMTYESGENHSVFIVDIFNPDGIFTQRKSLNIWVWNGFLHAKMKEDLLYCLQEKENGYKRLVVYKINWVK